MKCIILAAGQGTRLRTTEVVPKSLFLLNEEPLIRRQIDTFYKAGIREFVVITGFMGDQVKAYVDTIDLAECTITCVQNDEWQKENGISLLKAKPYIDSNFYFTMSDHYFELGFVKAFMQNKLDSDCLRLAIDIPSEKNKHINLEDVTKVALDGNKILNIGKMLQIYQAYDTGLFFCTTEVFHVLEENSRNNEFTISGCVKKLALAGKATVAYLGDYFWNDIDDPADLEATENYLRKK